MNQKDFQIMKTLDVNPFGQVYLVQNLKNHRQYVSKTIFKTFKNEEEKIEFSLNIQKLQQLQCQSLIKVIFFSLTNFFNEDYPTIFTEFAPARCLREFYTCSQSQQQLSSTEKYINLLGIALGLRYLHSQNLFYYNMQPDDVFLDENMHPHISVLRLASTFEKSEFLYNLTKYRLNSLQYIAPEILDKNAFNSKADVYSYGLIAYSIISGKEPSVDGPSYKQIENLVSGKRPDLSVIENEELRKFIAKCWSKNADQRPTFDEIVETLMNKEFSSMFDVDLPLVMNYLHNFEDNENTNSNFYKNVVEKKIDQKMEFNVILIGEVNSGKTALFETYLNGIKTLETYPTIEPSFNAFKIQTDFGEVKLTICDTTGYERFNILLPTYLRTAGAAVFFTDVSSRAEYKNLNRYIEIVNKNAENILKYLSVTKCDLEWKNTKEELNMFAEKNNMMVFLTSCTNTESIEKMFKQIATDLIMKFINL